MQRSRTKRMTRARPRAKKSAQALPYHHLSHEGALIREVLSGADAQPTTREAMALVYTLSNLTDSIGNVTYRRGFHAGRLLFSMGGRGGGFRWHEDSMPELVRFLESTGHWRVTYHAFPGDFWLRLNGKGAVNIRGDAHTFEAGLIAGFVSASRRHTVGVSETMCAMDGHGECVFSVHSSARKNAGRESLESLVGHVSRMVSSGSKPKPDVPSAYYALASQALYSSSYMDALKQIMSHIGLQVAEKTIAGRKKMLGPALSSISILGLGKPTLRRQSPIELYVRFTGRHIRREQAELSVAFISGLLNNLVAKNRELEASISQSRGSYTVGIREVRSSQGR